MAKLDFDTAEYEDRIAAAFLREGSFDRAIAMLEAGKPVGPALRGALASLLRGEDGARFKIHHAAGGAPRRRAANFFRDLELAEAVEEMSSRSNLSIDGACARIAEQHPLALNDNLGKKSVSRAYYEVRKAKTVPK